MGVAIVAFGRWRSMFRILCKQFRSFGKGSYDGFSYLCSR